MKADLHAAIMEYVREEGDPDIEASSDDVGDSITEVPVPTKEPGGDPDVDTPTESDEDPIEDRQVQINLDVDKIPTRSLTPAEELALAKLEHLANNRLNGFIGQEGFIDAVSNTVAGLGNVFGHFISLLATGLFDGWRDFKRSELSEYVQSNSVTVLRIYNTNDIYATDVQVPHPEGMKGYYSKAIKSLQDFLIDLSLLKRMDKMVTVTDTIVTDLHRQNVTFGAHVKDAHKLWVSPQSDRYFKETEKIFTLARETTDGYEPFRTRFIDLQDFKHCVQTVTGMDSELRSVASVHSRMQELDKKYQQVMQYKENLNANHVKDLSTMLRALGTALDRYAIALKNLNRVNHNLTYCFKEMRKTFNM